MSDKVNFHGSQSENDVITWRGVRNFEWKPQLGVGDQRLPLYAIN